MRFIFFLMILAGAALGIGYPWAVTNFGGQGIGTWTVFDRTGGFQPVTTRLASGNAPVRATVDLTVRGTPAFTGDSAVLTLTVSHSGKTVLATTLSFAKSVAREVSPQSADKVYRAEAGTIPQVEDGDYVFTIGRGDADAVDIRSVALLLRGGALGYDDRAQPFGFALMALGFIGFAIALRRSRPNRETNPNSQTPPPRWGRG